jgi:transposase
MNQAKFYLGIDIGKYIYAVCLTNSEGKALFKLKISSRADGWQKLTAAIKQHVPDNQWKDIHSGLEATGPYWLTFYEQLKKQGVIVTVLNPIQTRAYRNEGIRGAKTDRVDAELIAKIIRFGNYTETQLPSEDIIALKQLTRLRTDLTHTNSGFKRKILSLLDQIFPEYHQVFKETFKKSSRELLKTYTTPEEIAKLSAKKLTKFLETVSYRQLNKERAKAIHQAAKESIGAKLGQDAIALSIKVLLAQVEHLEQQIENLEKEIAERFRKQNTKLTTIPGISEINGATILAEIGNFNRFIGKDGAEKLTALAGVDPKVIQSGTLQGKAKMSKRGSPYFRYAIRMAAFVATQHDPMFKAILEKQKDRGKHFEVALSHVERKLVHVIYSVLKNNKNYQPIM